jgi:hypothetical protein
VLREATRSLIQIAGSSSVDLRSERAPSASVFYVSARSLCSEGALKLVRQLRSRDIGSALRASHPVTEQTKQLAALAQKVMLATAAPRIP